MNKEYLNEQHQKSKKEYENLNEEYGKLSDELFLMVNSDDYSEKEITGKEEELKVIKDRLFDVYEKMQGFSIAKAQILIEQHQQDKLKIKTRRLVKPNK